MTQTQNNESKKEKKIKKKGFLRWEAIIPFVIIWTLIGVYFTLFLILTSKKLSNGVAIKLSVQK